MVNKWTMCIDVSCYPNPGRATMAYVIVNNASNDVFHRKWDISARTTNNEAYYIALIEGLKSAQNYGANDISVFTNSELVCKQMKGEYEVRKVNLKPLYKEAKNIAVQFQSFTINHHSDIKRMLSGLLSGTMSTLGESVKDKVVSKSIPSKSAARHCYSSGICICLFVIFFLVSVIVWLFH